MVELLNCELDERSSDWQHLSQVFKAMYGVLHTYTEGKSKKNAWYFAKYIDFFTSALGQRVMFLIVDVLAGSPQQTNFILDQLLCVRFQNI